MFQRIENLLTFNFKILSYEVNINAFWVSLEIESKNVFFELGINPVYNYPDGAYCSLRTSKRYFHKSWLYTNEKAV